MVTTFIFFHIKCNTLLPSFAESRCTTFFEMSFNSVRFTQANRATKGIGAHNGRAYADECRSSRTKDAQDGRHSTSYTHIRLRVQRHAFGTTIIVFRSARLANEKGERYHAAMARSRCNEMASSRFSHGTPILRFTLQPPRRFLPRRRPRNLQVAA